jgi:hypothetical protein
LTILLFCISSFLSTTHIHDNLLEKHNDCKICLLTKNFDNGDTPTIQSYHLKDNFYYESILFFKYYDSINILKGFNANAPPLSS